MTPLWSNHYSETQGQVVLYAISAQLLVIFKQHFIQCISSTQAKAIKIKMISICENKIFLVSELALIKWTEPVHVHYVPLIPDMARATT